MSRQQEREEFVAIMAKEGVTLHVARLLMRASTTLHRLAELECSSEAADRDRVPCPESRKPGRPREGKTGRASRCLCEHWRSDDGRGCGCANPLTPTQHHKVPRIAVKAAQTQARVERICRTYRDVTLVPIFNGDPRGAVLRVKVPSGRTNDGGQIGICVP